MCVAPALSLWLGGWLHSFLAMSQARPMAEVVLIVVSRSRRRCVLLSKQRVKRFVTKLSFSLSDVGSDPSRIPLDPWREHGDGLGRSPESSPSLLLLWVLFHMNGKKRAWEQKGSLIYISPRWFLFPHCIQGLPLLDQVNTMKPKVAQLAILPSTKPGATKETGNLFKNRIFLSCKSDWCWC